MIDSIYIADNQGGLIVQRDFKGQQFREDVLKLVAEQSMESKSPSQLNSLPIAQINGNFFFYKKKGNITIIAITTTDGYPTEIFTIIGKILTALEIHFDEITAQRCKDNLSNLYLMIEEMLDFGIPVLSEPKMIGTILSSESIAQKVQNKFKRKVFSRFEEVETFVKTTEHKNMNENFIFWNDSKKVGAPEIKFDVVENFECILDNELFIQDIKIYGKLYSISHLSDNPEVSFHFKTSSPLDDFSLHKCAYESYQIFKNNGVVRFFPQNSASSVLHYQLDQMPISLPFDLKYNFSLQKESVVMSLRLSKSMIQGRYLDMKNFNLKIFFPGTPISNNVGSSDGSFYYTSGTKCGEWILEKVNYNSIYKLEGSFKMSSMEEIHQKNIIIKISYFIQNFTYSGAKIFKVVIRNPQQKATKLARYRLYAKNIEIRIPGLF